MPLFADSKGLPLKPYLDSKAEAAHEHVNNLTRSALSKEKESLVKDIIDRYFVAPLQLSDKPKFELPDSEPLKAYVTWQITGDTQLLGYRDGRGEYLSQMQGKSSIKDIFTHTSPIADQAHIIKAIQERVPLKAQAYQAHFDLLNLQVEDYNRFLKENVPSWVDARVMLLTKQKAAEDLLNGN